MFPPSYGNGSVPRLGEDCCWGLGMAISADGKRRMAARMLWMLLASTTAGGAAIEPPLSYRDRPCGVPSSPGTSPFLEDHATGRFLDDRVRRRRDSVERPVHPEVHPRLPRAIPSSPNPPECIRDGIELNRLIEMAQRRADIA